MDYATYCREMLPKVSRTFALTIRLLPPSLEFTVTVAYLLCRIADTIEDSSGLDAALKVRLLEHFRSCLQNENVDLAPLRSSFASHATSDQQLVFESDRVLKEYWKLPDAERAVIRPAVQEMCGGMAKFVALMEARAGKQRMIESVTELEQYCYYVAGTVGQLLTGLFALQWPQISSARSQRLRALSGPFAEGLQLTNIVQDVATDSARGVVFVPEDLPSADGALKVLVRIALKRLWDAIEYCSCIPRRHFRIRLFCILPAYLAVQTLRAVEKRIGATLQESKPKLSRAAVYRSVLITFAVAPSNTLMRGYFRMMANGVGRS